MTKILDGLYTLIEEADLEVDANGDPHFAAHAILTDEKPDEYGYVSLYKAVWWPKEEWEKDPFADDSTACDWENPACVMPDWGEYNVREGRIV